MASSLKQNFEQYCRDYQTALEEEMETPAEEFQGEKAKDKKPEYGLYDQLRNVNGKKGDEIVSSLLSSVFDENTNKIEQHLATYFEKLTLDKVLAHKDVNNGLSRFSDLLPDLCMDCPQIHQYLMDFLIKPLRDKKIVQYKQITWKFEKIKKDDDDDEIIFGTNPFFKLLALILVDMKLNHMDWKEICTSFDRTHKWQSVADEKHTHIEDADDLWKEIE